VRSGFENGWPRLSRVALAAVLALGAIVYASNVRAQNLTPVRIANFQNTVALALYHGIDKGYFKEAGLDIELIKVASGAASVQAVAAGQADVGGAATAVPMFARANGVKVKMFMTVDQEGPPNHYGTFYIASGKSGVTDFKNIKGKTIVINAFGTAGELGFRERLQKAGIAWEDIKTVVVPFPQMPAALELGNGDVVCTIQPMAAAILANKAIDAKTLDRGTITASATQPVTASAYFATDDWIAKNEKTALAFGRAFLRAQKELHADQKMRIDLVMKIAGMDRATAETIPEAWFETLSVKKESAAPNYDALVKTGMLKNPFPIDEVIATLPY
jgi:ABC-type nitrate/sulfonate/bicarbonate transport system substrate-binding protein